MPFTFSTRSVTSSRTPATEENSCTTPCIWIAFTAAPCSEESRTRRSAFPSVVPKPRSRGPSETTACRSLYSEAVTAIFSGFCNSCQFRSIIDKYPFCHSYKVIEPMAHYTCPASSAIKREKLYPATLSRAATIMWNWGDIPNRAHGKANCLKCA